MATLVKFTCKSFIKLTPGCCPVYMTRFYQPVVVVFRIVIIVYRVCLRLEHRLIGSAWKYQRVLHVHISQRTGVILHKKKPNFLHPCMPLQSDARMQVVQFQPATKI